MTTTASPSGHVYILTSAHSRFIKIGGTAHAPLKRIREINACTPYKAHGPWTLHDFRQVTDWRNVESQLHYALRSKLVTSILGQKEIFDVAAQNASDYLAELDPSLIVKKPTIDRMFQDAEFAVYMEKLFRTTAILNWLDIQGGWTFSLFPSTAGGRYFTLNIGRHEVAFSSLATPQWPTVHMVYMDQLVYDFEETHRWLSAHSGELSEDRYASSKGHSVAVFFSGTMVDAAEFLDLPGVRRAILAYWGESLAQLQDQGSQSLFARYHHWNAVAELRRRIQGMDLGRERAL